MSPISLYEFNRIANVTGDENYVKSYSINCNECYQPFVGKPYIFRSEPDSKSKSPSFIPGSLNYSRGLSQIRLRFTPVKNTPTDDQLYKYSLNR